MNEIVIQNAQINDIENIQKLKINTWQHSYKGIIDDEYLSSMEEQIEDKINKMKKDLTFSNIIIAKKDNEIVGFSRFIFSNQLSPEINESDCELSALYVKNNLKCNGIGTLLFKEVVKRFQDKNKHNMIIWCLKENEPSKKFYFKMGGKIIAEKEITIGNNNYKEVCFLYNI